MKPTVVDYPNEIYEMNIWNIYMKDHQFIVDDYIVYSTSTTTHPPLPPPHPHQGKTKFNVHCQGNFFGLFHVQLCTLYNVWHFTIRKNPSSRIFFHKHMNSSQCLFCHTNISQMSIPCLQMIFVWPPLSWELHFSFLHSLKW